MAKSYSRFLIDSICDYLETRANDPWDDDVWPAANKVLTIIVSELRDSDLQHGLSLNAWGQFGASKNAKARKDK